MRSPLLILPVLLVAACGSNPPAQPATPEPQVTMQAVDNVKRAPLTDVKLPPCKYTVDEFDMASVDWTAQIKNTTGLTGELTITTKLVNGKGVTVGETEGGASNVAPGETVKVHGTNGGGLDPNDFPNKTVTCPVTNAEVYVPVQ